MYNVKIVQNSEVDTGYLWINQDIRNHQLIKEGQYVLVHFGYEQFLGNVYEDGRINGLKSMFNRFEEIQGGVELKIIDIKQNNNFIEMFLRKL